EMQREALKGIVAALVAMAGLGSGRSAVAGRQSQSAHAVDDPTAPDCLLPAADCRTLLPRHLHRAILRLLRPAESATRRLVIALACRLARPPASRPPGSPKACKAKPASLLVRDGVGTGIVLRSGAPVPAHLA